MYRPGLEEAQALPVRTKARWGLILRAQRRPRRVACAWLLRSALAGVMALPGPELIVSVAHAQRASVSTATGEAFSTQQLDALLAPIALYPDELLMQMLLA